MTSITFTGDIAFSKYFKEHWNKDFLDEKIKEFLNNADHVVANVESPLTEAGISNMFIKNTAILFIITDFIHGLF